MVGQADYFSHRGRRFARFGEGGNIDHNQVTVFCDGIEKIAVKSGERKCGERPCRNRQFTGVYH